MGELLRLASLASAIVVLGAGPLQVLDAAEKASKAGKAEAKQEKDSSEGVKAAEEAAPAGPSVKPADFWVLDFKFQKVAMIQPTEGIHRGEIYWYMLYQIENKTGQDREAFISITARSNKNKTYANIYVPDVEAIIERKAGKPLWGKTEEFQALKERAEKKEGQAEKTMPNYFHFKAGSVLDCVAIFNKLDPGATNISVTVDGLSNDLHRIERENASPQIESRIFVVELERPGDEYGMSLDRFLKVRDGWSKKLTDLVMPKDMKKDGQKDNPKEK